MTRDELIAKIEEARSLASEALNLSVEARAKSELARYKAAEAAAVLDALSGALADGAEVTGSSRRT